MTKVPREKIALLVFVALVAVSFVGLSGYLALGHSWNVAASTIDDATGDLEGYTVIVYPGTVDAELAARAAAEKEREEAEAAREEREGPEGRAGSESAFSAAREDGASDEGSDGAESLFEDVFGEPDVAGSAAGVSVDAAVSAGAADSVDPADLGDSAGLGEGADADGPAVSAALPDLFPTEASDDEAYAGGGELAGHAAADDEAAGLGAADSGSKGGAGASYSAANRPGPVSLEEVEEGYQDKGATVVLLDTLDAEKYAEGSIVKRGEHRFGVFSTDERTTKYHVRQMVAYFEKHEVDFIVAIAEDVCVLSIRSLGIPHQCFSDITT